MPITSKDDRDHQYAAPPATDLSASGSEQVLLGVDTHKHEHVAAVITTIGALLEVRTFPATGAGYAELLAWAC